MARVVETRQYLDGTKRLRAQVLGNGCVAFAVLPQQPFETSREQALQLLAETAAISSTVLRQLADLADRVNESTSAQA